MQKRTTPSFKPEFRQEAAQPVVDHGYSIREATEAMNVSKSSMENWIRQLRQERRGEMPQASPISEDKQRIRELEKKLKRAEMEIDILKKTTALLMSDSMNNLR